MAGLATFGELATTCRQKKLLRSFCIVPETIPIGNVQILKTVVIEIPGVARHDQRPHGRSDRDRSLPKLPPRDFGTDSCHRVLSVESTGLLTGILTEKSPVSEMRIPAAVHHVGT